MNTENVVCTHIQGIQRQRKMQSFAENWKDIKQNILTQKTHFLCAFNTERLKFIYAYINIHPQ